MLKSRCFGFISALSLFIAVAAFSGATVAVASTSVEVGEEVYAILSRLEAEGVIQSAILTAKPLSRKEVVRLILEAEKNAQGRSAFIQRYVEILKEKFRADLEGGKYIKLLDSTRLSLIHTDKVSSVSQSPNIKANSSETDLSYNNDGYEYQDGMNSRMEFRSRGELGWFSYYLKPEVRYSDSDLDVLMEKIYGVLAVKGWELQVGTDSQWWGPGYFGSILLSNNAQPFPMAKFTNTSPIYLPWILKHLGLFKFTAFVTRLEEDRVVPEPYLWGMRLNFKPIPYFEVALQRTALLGGEGRPEGFSTWWDSFWGRNEDDPAKGGDQRAGFDAKLTVPLKVQPFQLYFDGAGEDEAGGWPSNWAYLFGIYLPRILDFERVELRAEYVNTYYSSKPYLWYNNTIYRSGYTYEGRIIGHHVGTDSTGLFVEGSYLIPEVNGRVSLGYSMKEHNRSADVQEKKNEVYISTHLDVMKSLNLRAAYAYGLIDNLNSVSGNDRTINTFFFQAEYGF